MDTQEEIERYMFENGRKVMSVQREDENAITIYIGGHGLEDFTTFFEGNVELLSFSGYPSSLGRFFTGNSDEFFKVTKELKNQYHSKTESQSDIFARMPEILRTLYRTNNFPIDEYFRAGGFKITNPKFSRKFSLEPNPGELDARQYGIYIIDASNPLDNEYTLSTRGVLSSGMRFTRDHWLQRIESYWEEKQARLQEQKSELLSKSKSQEEMSEINDEYEKYTKYNNKKKEDTKRILRDIIDIKKVTLEDLVNFFRNIGYLKVYIYDPSCRAGEGPVGYSREGRSEGYYLQEGKQRHSQRAFASIWERVNPKKINKFAEFVKTVIMPAKTRKVIDKIQFLNNGINYIFETDQLIYVFIPTFINYQKGIISNYKVFIGRIDTFKPNLIKIKFYHADEEWAGIMEIDTSIPVDTNNYTLDIHNHTLANICEADNLEAAVEIFKTRFPQIAEKIIPSLERETEPREPTIIKDMDGGSYKNRKMKHRKTKRRKTKHTKTKHRK